MTATRPSSCALIATVLVVIGVAAGDDARSSGAERRLVVMSDGRILEGVVSRQATGYYVERPNGRIVVPFEQVRCVARDLLDAYRQQREAQQEPTAADLVQLAEWGITYRLYDEARDELKRALRRDPEHDVARRMLARLEDTLMAKPVPPRTPLLISSTGLVTPEVEALGGFSRPTAAQFTERIQPLLVNKCGQARCHGTESQQEFRLTMVRFESRNHRRASEQNLAMVLQHVDFEHPQQSSLLTATQGTHGGLNGLVFGGAAGADQERMLKDWIKTIVVERRNEQERFAEQPRLSQKPAPATAAVSVEPKPIEQTTGISAAPPESPTVSGGDAFDPEEFNRKFASAPASRR